MNTAKLIGVMSVIVGACVMLHGVDNLTISVREREYKAFALPGSPYGEIVGLALQDPVHLLSHGGIGHQHIRNDGKVCTVCGVTHLEEDHDGGEGRDDDSMLGRAKLALLDLSAGIRQNHNPGGHSGSVVEYEEQKMRELVHYAYELDPTNFGNYNMYAHFVITHGIATGRYTMDDFYHICEATILTCEGREEDPEDALTAASAAEHLLIYKTRGVNRADYWKYESEYNCLKDQVKRFERNQERAELEGRLKEYKPEKQNEILQRYKGFYYVMHNYGRLIAESKKKREK